MPVKIFCCYAHEDEAFLNKLKIHLAPLQRKGLIDIWHDRDISAGTDWEREISDRLNAAQIILLLVSPDFMYSDYCYGTEMKRALERHERKEARVIPVILRPVHWQEEPLGKLQALPTDAKPVTSASWHNLDEAFLSITEGISKVIEQFKQQPTTPVGIAGQPAIFPPSIPGSPPSLLDKTMNLLDQPLRAVHRTILSRRFKPSRRAVVLGLAGLTMAGGGVIWLELFHKPQGTTLFIYKGHTDAVFTVAWSPNGQYIASGSADGTVHIWEAKDGNRLFKYVSHSTYDGNVYGVVWSPDSKRVASGYGYPSGAVEVWDIGSQNYYSYEGHANSTGGVRAVAWSRDGKYLASGGGFGDGTVQVWNADTGKSIYTYPGHSKSTSGTNGVNTVAWSPDGARIASGGDDTTVQVWDARDGGHPYRYLGHTDAVNTVAWSPDGARIASGSNDKTIQVWDAMGGGHLYRHLGHTDAVNTVAWSPDGTHIALGSGNKTAQVWDARDSNHVYIYDRHSDTVTALVWSSDGTRIASGSDDKTVQVWQAI